MRRTSSPPMTRSPAQAQTAPGRQAVARGSADVAQALLVAVQQAMAARMSLFSFRGFIEPLWTEDDGLVDDTLTVCAPSRFHADWVRDHYAAELTAAVHTVVGRALSLVVVAREPHAAVPALDVAPTTAAPPPAPASKRATKKPAALASVPAASMPAASVPAASSMPAASIAAPPVESTSALRLARLQQQAQAAPETLLPAHNTAPAPLRSTSEGHAHVMPMAKRTAPVKRPRLHPHYTFETFVAGPQNRMALQAARTVVEQPGSRYAPLFLLGTSGLGKTHLLHAIGNAIAARQDNTRVVYVSAEQFVNEYITDVHERRFDAFRKRYRDDCDVLLIDDIHFLAGKTASQDEFFHTFNALHQAHKQIVVASDRYPHDITGLDERLKTRLQWGLVADVKSPDFDTRLAILQAKVQAQATPLAEEVLVFLAAHVQHSVRELEGALARLTAYAAVTREPLTVAQAQEHLRPVLMHRASEATATRVTEVVATYFGLRSADVVGPSRQRQVTRARQLAMWLCRKHLKLSFPELGRAFGGRDHTTAMSSVKKIEGLHRDNDVAVVQALRRLEQSLFGIAGD